MTEATNAPAPGGTSAAPGAAPDAAAQAAASATPAQPLNIGADPAATTPAADTTNATSQVSYDKTGDLGLDMALDFVGKLGLGPEDPTMAAAIKGDFSLLKAKLGALGDKAKGWENFVALAEKSHKDTSEKTAARVAKDTAAIHTAVGGKEQWAAISEWAGKNADPEEKTAVNATLAQGGIAGKAMAMYLSGLYQKAGGTTVEPAQVVTGDAAGKSATPGALTAKAYATEVQALRAKMGYAMEGSQEYQALQARRIAGVNSRI